MKLEMKQRMEQTDFKKLADEARAKSTHFQDLTWRCANAIDALLAEREELRQTNSRLNRRCQAAEAGMRQNVEACEKAGLSLGRSLANAGYYSLIDDNAALRAKLAKATEALTKLADKWERRECMTDAYQLAANELRAALDKIKEAP